jgi:hypothetical protein
MPYALVLRILRLDPQKKDTVAMEWGKNNALEKYKQEKLYSIRKRVRVVGIA